jgi:hypothetical protein
LKSGQIYNFQIEKNYSATGRLFVGRDVPAQEKQSAENILFRVVNLDGRK